MATHLQIIQSTLNAALLLKCERLVACQIHSFGQQIFSEHLLGVSHYARHRDKTGRNLHSHGAHAYRGDYSTLNPQLFL